MGNLLCTTNQCTSLYTNCKCTNCKCTNCKTQTTLCNYYFRYKKNICSNCIHFIKACSHCNEWYASGLIRYNERLFCVKCLTDFNNIIIKDIIIKN